MQSIFKVSDYMRYMDALSRYYQFLSYSSNMTTTRKNKKSIHISGKLSINGFLFWIIFSLFLIFFNIAFYYANKYLIHIDIRKF